VRNSCDECSSDWASLVTTVVVQHGFQSLFDVNFLPREAQQLDAESASRAALWALVARREANDQEAADHAAGGPRASSEGPL
jgi:hypothetical protein